MTYELSKSVSVDATSQPVSSPNLVGDQIVRLSEYLSSSPEAKILQRRFCEANPWDVSVRYISGHVQLHLMMGKEVCPDMAVSLMPDQHLSLEMIIERFCSSSI